MSNETFSHSMPHRVGFTNCDSFSHSAMCKACSASDAEDFDKFMPSPEQFLQMYQLIQHKTF